MLDFSHLSNIYKIPGLEEIIRDNLNFIHHYPDYEHRILIQSIAKKFNIPSNSVTIGNGATEIIFSLPYIIDKKKVVVCYPTFWQYTNANIKIKKKLIIDFFTREDTNFELDLDDLESSLPSPCVVYLCNPNNPTSTLIEKAHLLTFIKNNSDADFVIDETYLIFREDYDQQSLLKESVEMKNLYVVTSLSKLFFIPGLRIGFLCSHPENIKEYYERAIPYLANPLAEKVIPYALSRDDYILQTRLFYSKQRPKAYKLFNKEFRSIIKAFKPEANFILLKILTDKTSTQTVNDLYERGIIIRDGYEYKGLGNKWIRVGIRSIKENDQLITALRQILVN